MHLKFAPPPNIFMSFENFMTFTREQPQKNFVFMNTQSYNTQFTIPKPYSKWLSLKFNQNFNAREITFKAYNNSNYKVGRITRF